MPTEDQEQAAVVAYLEMRGLVFSSIPNHTYTTSWKQKQHNRNLGLRAGLPDLLIVLPETGLLFLEMKRVKGGVVSEVQKAWIEALQALPNVAAHVARGADEAIKIIEDYYPKSLDKGSDF